VQAEWRTGEIAAIALAFAAGCLPSARLVARLMSGRSIEELGDGKPGAANVYRSLGIGPGAVVLTLDALKSLVPAAALRASGGSDTAVAVAAAAAVAAHITIVGGQGVATGLGAGFAIDGPATCAAVGSAVGGTCLGRSAHGVLAAMVVFPVAYGLRRRSWVATARPAMIVALLIAARLRGRPGAGWPGSTRLALSRLLIDQDG